MSEHSSSQRDSASQAPKDAARSVALPGPVADMGPAGMLVGTPGTSGAVAPPRPPESVLALQRTVGNAVVGRLLEPATAHGAFTPAGIRRAPPTDGMDDAAKQAYDAATPTPLAKIDDLITLIERVEAAYPSETWQGISTRLRKSYYDDNLWNQLIEKRAGYPGVMSPPLSMSDFKALGTAKNHPELLANGESVDIGHVFTGIDASNNPDVGNKFWLSGIDGPPGATWSGDVGSALAEWDVAAGSNRGRRQEFYERFASSDDMLGDVDGIAIAKQPVAPGAADKLSTRLRDYYLPNPNASAKKRFTTFTQASGFAWSGSGAGIKLAADARKRIRSQVDNFGVAFRRKKEGIFGGAGQNWFHAEDLDWFVDRFVQWVEKGLAAENP
jgi:hypothetical protein